MSDPYTNFYMIMLPVAGLFALLTLIYVVRAAMNRQGGEIGGWELRGAARRVGAIARTTLSEGIRAKAGAGFALIILIAIPIFWFTANGDGTIKGQVQMFLSYSLGFTTFLLSLLTIFFSCRSLSNEIASRQIYGIVSKPVPRWQIIAGKWIGVMALNVILLSIATVAVYVGTLGTIGRFKRHLTHELETYGALKPDQAEATVAALDQVKGIGKEGLDSPVVTAFMNVLGKSREAVGEILLRLPEATRMNLRKLDEMRRQVVVARAAVGVELPDVREEVDKRYAKLKEAGELPQGWSDSKIRKQIETALYGQFSTVPPGPQFMRQWRIAGPKPVKGRDVIMSVRFKLNAPGYIPPYDEGGDTFDENTLFCAWGIGNPSKSNFVQARDAYPVNSFYELEVPSFCLEDDGTLILSFVNLDPRKRDLSFDFQNHGLEVLYHVGSFETGLAQASLAALVPIACLASFGVFASTFLSFPVGTLIVLTLYILGSSMGFIADALAVTKDYTGPYSLGLEFEIRRASYDLLGWALATGDLDPVNKLIDGRAIGWGPLWNDCWKFVLLKGMAVFVLAVLVIRRRELAAVIV